MMNSVQVYTVISSLLIRFLDKRSGRIVARRWLAWHARQARRQYPGQLNLWVLCRQLPSMGAQETLQAAVRVGMKGVVDQVTFVPHDTVRIWQVLILPSQPITPAPRHPVGPGCHERGE